MLATVETVSMGCSTVVPVAASQVMTLPRAQVPLPNASLPSCAQPFHPRILPSGLKARLVERAKFASAVWYRTRPPERSQTATRPPEHAPAMSTHPPAASMVGMRMSPSINASALALSSGRMGKSAKSSVG